MNTMRLVFAIAIALALHGTSNAANLRRAAAETGVTAADATVIATLRNKYDCRQAGATLAETWPTKHRTTTMLNLLHAMDLRILDGC